MILALVNIAHGQHLIELSLDYLVFSFNICLFAHEALVGLLELYVFFNATIIIAQELLNFCPMILTVFQVIEP